MQLAWIRLRVYFRVCLHECVRVCVQFGKRVHAATRSCNSISDSNFMSCPALFSSPHLLPLKLSARVASSLLALQPQAIGVSTETIRVEEAIHAQANAAALVAAEMIARLRHTLLVALAGYVCQQLLRIGQRYLMLQLAHYQRRLPRPVVVAVH